MARSSTLPSHPRRGGHEARPVLTTAREALNKAERFADLSEQTADEGFESVIYGAYFAMFHAARAALFAVEGKASTRPAGVGANFARLSAGPDLRARCWSERAICMHVRIMALTI